MLVKRNQQFYLLSILKFFSFIFAFELVYSQQVYSIPKHPYEIITGCFASLDSLIHSISHDANILTRKYSLTDKYFLNISNNNPAISGIIRTNHRGVVVSEVSFGKIKQRKFRHVRRQKWFRAVAKTSEPYNSSYIKNKSKYFLLWVVPIIVKKENKVDFKGTIAMHIDLEKLFNTIIEEQNIQLTVMQKDRKIISNLDSTASKDIVKKEMRIKGIDDGFVVEYNKPVQKPDQDSIARIRAAELKQMEEEMEKNKAINKRNVMIFNSFVAGTITISFLIFIVGIYIKREKQKKLIEMIDNDKY